jgi:hypothetical protein
MHWQMDSGLKFFCGELSGLGKAKEEKKLAV